MQIEVTQDMLHAINQYKEHSYYQTQVVSSKKQLYEREECRSAAVELMNAILRANPELCKGKFPWPARSR